MSLGEKPINFKVAPVAAVKKETPSEDYSSWGQESATSNVDQENICESSLYLLRSMNSLTAIDFSSKGNRLRPKKGQTKKKAVLKHLLPRALLKEALNHHRLKFGTSQPQQSLLHLPVMYLLIRFISIQKRKTIQTAKIYMSQIPT